MVISSVFSESVSTPKSGVVFDTVTSLPVSGVFVLLYSESGNLATDFSDRNGNYRIAPKPDTYILKAQDGGYVFPSAKSQNELRNYSHVYVPGQPITVTTPDHIVSHYSIPLDPANGSVRHAVKRFWEKSSVWRLIIVSILFLVSGYASVTAQGTINLATFGVLGLYGGSVFFRKAFQNELSRS